MLQNEVGIMENFKGWDTVDKEKYKYLVEVEFFEEEGKNIGTKWGKVYEWAKSMCEGSFRSSIHTATSDMFYFELASDATMFKLRWG